MRSRTTYFNALINKCNNTPNVDFVGQVSMKEVIPMTKKADVIICMIYPYNINTKWATANKQFEAIIKIRDNPKLCENLGKNASKTAINKYNWKLE